MTASFDDVVQDFDLSLFRQTGNTPSYDVSFRLFWNDVQKVLFYLQNFRSSDLKVYHFQHKKCMLTRFQHMGSIL